ncbi:MFS transporter [Flavisphingomonas formosensis]|uniref:MFS transporter n=1 Tax=Flavisphingomonas formosensis TaxID=861534 RepID=UPI0012F9D6F4
MDAGREHDPPRSRLRSIVGGATGNFIEWFDWFVFVSFALYFSPIFFPAGDRTVQLLQSAAILALGFVMRPLGALLFGLYADRRGRRAALTLSVGLMCAGSCIIALAPGYAEIGLAAPALLLVARLLQGLSVGGEYGASATYISEMSGRDRRGFWSSFQCVTLVLGQLAALCLLLALQALLSDAAMRAWGWRLAFLIGAALAVVVLRLRISLSETEAFRQARTTAAQPSAARHLLSRHRRATWLVFGLTAAGSTGFYVFIGYSQKFLVNTAGFSAMEGTAITASALLLFLLAQPLFGLLSDVIGRRRTMMLSFGLCAALTVPIMRALAVATDPVAASLLLSVLLLSFSGYSAIGAIVKAELYPAPIRALGVGLPYAIANALFGGLGEFAALWFKRIGHESGFFLFLALMMLAGLAVAWCLPETRDTGPMAEEI